MRTAYHSTSLKGLRWITIDGELALAVNVSDGKEGIYCEGEHRKHCSVPYSTLNRRHNSETDPIVYSDVLKLGILRDGSVQELDMCENSGGPSPESITSKECGSMLCHR